jgi:hypothetical protein
MAAKGQRGEVGRQPGGGKLDGVEGEGLGEQQVNQHRGVEPAAASARIAAPPGGAGEGQRGSQNGRHSGVGGDKDRDQYGDEPMHAG